MGRIGGTELLLILLVALLIFGPSKLADLGKSLGEGLKNFKKGIAPDDEPNRPKPPSPPAATPYAPPAPAPPAPNPPPAAAPPQPVGPVAQAPSPSSPDPTTNRN